MVEAEVIMAIDPSDFKASRTDLTKIGELPFASANVKLYFDLNSDLQTNDIKAPYVDNDVLQNPIDAQENDAKFDNWFLNLKGDWSSKIDDTDSKSFTEKVTEVIAELFDKSPQLNELITGGPVTIDQNAVAALLDGNIEILSKEQAHVVLDGAAEHGFVQLDESQNYYNFNFPPEKGIGVQIKLIDNDQDSANNIRYVNLLLVQPTPVED